MKTSRRPAGFMAIVALAFALILGSGVPRARAAAEDVAMFYDDLSQYGQWAEYENYGPVWRPSQVPQDWRPYTNGRWVPTDNGYVFETQEPWGWATYHYGNWVPTQNYGWVWVPGRTWYPSTVEWRTSQEETAPDDSYVGWAPIPPDNYVPPQEYAPPSYNQGNPVVDALTSPFWIFVKAASFLLGLGQPYAPAYSYAYSGVLVPQPYVQVFYPQTVIVRRYYTPAYYPPAYFRGHHQGFYAYNWGPPASYFYRRGRVNQAAFDRALHHNSLHISRIHSVVPPNRVLNRQAYLRQIMPPALAQGQRLPSPRRVTNYRAAQASLYKPNVVRAPRQVPPVKAPIPKLTHAAGFQRGHKMPSAHQVSPRQTAPGTPATPRTHGIHATPGRVPAGKFRPGPGRAATRVTKPRPAPVSASHRVATPAPRQPQQRYQRQRQPQIPGRYQQPRHQQVRQPQTPRQPQVYRQPRTPRQPHVYRRPRSQNVQRRRAPQVKQQQVRQRQPYQRAPQHRVRTQPARQPQRQVQPRPQPQRQPKAQHQHQRRRQHEE
jgi:hypothetical protein